jgi:hypothetical protein
MLLIFCLALASCATAPRYPITYYEAPNKADSATIVGEQSLNSLIPVLFDDNKVYVAMVEDDPVRDPRRTATEPLSLQPGHRAVVVAQRMGRFHGATSLEFDAVSGVAYVIRYQQNLEGTNFMTRPIWRVGGLTFFWIEEQATGKRVSEQVEVNVTVDQQSAPFPIFIPR